MHDDLYGNPGLGRFAAPREQRVEVRAESNMLRMGLVAGGIAGLVLVLLSVWSWVGHRHGGVPVVDADTRPAREKPSDQGGLKVDGADAAILSGKSDSKPNVAPAPEAPALAALRATPPAPTPAAPPSVITAPPGSAGTVDDGVRVSRLAETPQRPLLNTTTPAAPAPQKATTAETQAAKPSAPTQMAAAAAAKPAAPAATSTAVPVKRTAEGKAGVPMVQLGALGSQQGANAEWGRLSKKYAELLGGHAPVISPVTHDGKTLWRLRVSGFEDKGAANTLCMQLKSSGAQCMIVPNG